MYTKQDIDAWLGPLTDSSVSRQASTVRQMTRQIWTVSWKGALWAIAADGKSLVLVAGDYGYDAAPADGVKEWLVAFPESTGKEIPVTLDELREWTDAPPGCEEARCAKCGSRTGLIVPGWKMDYGTICGLLLDRRRLAHTLRGCRDQELTISAGKNQLWIHSANMQAVLMGIDRESSTFEAPASKIPVFEPSEKG